MSLRLLVVAVDGATFDHLLPVAEAGGAPTLARMMGEGIVAPLKSTMPPVSSPAWITFQTGKNPGKLGISEFFVKEPGGYRSRLARHKTDDATIWDYLSRGDKRIGVVCMHLTYPPHPVNGVMVSPVYATSDDYYFPATLGHEIEARIGRQDYEVLNRDRYLADPLGEHLRLEDNRLALVKAVWESQRGDFDLLACGFNVDRAQHYVVDREGLARCYNQIDSMVAELMDLTKPQNVLILSDHGGQAVRGLFRANQWLESLGYLRYRSKPQTMPEGLANVRKMLVEFLGASKTGRHILEAVRSRVPKAPLANHRLTYDVMVERDLIDWSRTRAFSPTKEGIYLNVAGREPQGIVPEGQRRGLANEVLNRLRQTVDPATGHPLTMDAYLREDVYGGDKVEQLPDIVFFTPDYLSSSICVGAPFGGLIDTKIGGHAMNGMLIAWGDLFRQGRAPAQANLIDMAPTILSAMDVACPDDMDGEVLDIFKVTPAKHTTAAGGPETITGEERTQTDEEILMERLRSLGYVE